MADVTSRIAEAGAELQRIVGDLSGALEALARVDDLLAPIEGSVVERLKKQYRSVGASTTEAHRKQVKAVELHKEYVERLAEIGIRVG